MPENVQYYLFENDLLVKKESGNYYLFNEGEWVIDDQLFALKSRMQEECPENSCSPDENTVADSLVEITEEEALEHAGQKLFDFLTTKWKMKFRERKIEWIKEHPGFYSKYVTTQYRYGNRKYVIYPMHIGLRNSGDDEAFMETVQGEMERDLRKYGATDILSFGFLD